MKRSTRALVLIAAAFAAGCATDEKTDSMAPAGASSPATPATAKSGALPVLKAGASADEIRATVGDPLKVTPMASPDGKAEVWLYERVLETHSEQVAVGVSTPPPATSTNTTMIAAPVMLYQNAEHTVYQETSLLMFNDKLVTAKQWVEKRTTFRN